VPVYYLPEVNYKFLFLAVAKMQKELDLLKTEPKLQYYSLYCT